MFVKSAVKSSVKCVVRTHLTQDVIKSETSSETLKSSALFTVFILDVKVVLKRL